MAQIDWLPEIGTHPGIGDRARIVDAGQVGYVGGPVLAGADVLPQRRAVPGEAQTAGVGFAHRITQRGIEVRQVKVAQQFHVLADAVDRRISTQALPIPDTELSGG